MSTCHCHCRKLQLLVGSSMIPRRNFASFSSLSSLKSVRSSFQNRASLSQIQLSPIAFRRYHSTPTRNQNQTQAESEQPVSHATGGSSSVKVGEVEKIERMSSSWWDHTGGEMKELHSMNRLRVPLIRDGLLQRSGKRIDGKHVPRPLEGMSILDIGCGGGILCEPLGRLGAMVTGIDPGQENITVARQHLPEDLTEKVSYVCTSIEEFIEKVDAPLYDAVVMSEVIEHVESPDNFVRSATEVLKPGGSLFLTTLNRTLESWMGAVVAWEYLLRKLPVGTHDWRKFITPTEIERMFKSNGLRTVLIHGMCYNPISNSWKWTSQRAINYAVHAVKE